MGYTGPSPFIAEMISRKTNQLTLVSIICLNYEYGNWCSKYLTCPFCCRLLFAGALVKCMFVQFIVRLTDYHCTVKRLPILTQSQSCLLTLSTFDQANLASEDAFASSFLRSDSYHCTLINCVFDCYCTFKRLIVFVLNCHCTVN